VSLVTEGVRETISFVARTDRRSGWCVCREDMPISPRKAYTCESTPGFGFLFLKSFSALVNSWMGNIVK